MPLAQEPSGPIIEFSVAPLFEDHGLALALMGVFVVFIALSLVVAFITILPRVVTRISSKARQQAMEAMSVAGDELPDETLVVIAAAVSEMIRHPHRIVRIRGLTSEDLGWSLEGRMEHHHSHTISPRRR